MVQQWTGICMAWHKLKYIFKKQTNKQIPSLTLKNTHTHRLISFCVFVGKAPLRKWTHRNNTPHRRRRETASEKNLLNKYSRKQEGNRATPLLHLTLIATASYLVKWQRIKTQITESHSCCLSCIKPILCLNSPWFHHFPMMTGSQCCQAVLCTRQT